MCHLYEKKLGGNSMKQGLEYFHEMESKYNLFEYGSEVGEPLWDYIRVSIYNDYIQGHLSHNNEVKKLSLSLRGVVEMLKGFVVLFKRNKYLFFICPRDIENKMKFDKISFQLTISCPESQRLVLYSMTTNQKVTPKSYSYRLIFYLLRKQIKIKKDYFPFCNEVKKAVEKCYNICVDVRNINSLLLEQIIEEKAYLKILSIIKPQKVFCSCDMMKPIYMASKKMGIKTYELQHAGIVFDYPSYSYPPIVDRKSNIAFADNYVMFGGSWGLSNNIPANRIVLGNNYFFKETSGVQFDKNYIVIVSDNIHGCYLKELAVEIAKKYSDYLIIYKLHPIEFSSYGDYENFFSQYNNIRIISNQYAMIDLIKTMSLMVLVYSSSFFEAVSNNKKVAVYKVDNYYCLKGYLEDNPNVLLFNEVDDLDGFIRQPECYGDWNFYTRFNNEKLKELF